MASGGVSMPTKTYVPGSDDELMQNVVNKTDSSEAFFELLVRRWNKSVYRFFMFAGPVPLRTASELTQETFLRIWRAQNYNPNGRFKGFLMTIARNVRNSALEKVGKNPTTPLTPELIDTLHAPIPSTELNESAKEVVDALNDCLRSVPDHFREVLLLRVLGDLSYEEIAAQMNAKPTDVKRWIHQARNLVKRSSFFQSWISKKGTGAK